ncbi:putative pectinesterase 52 [Impatiens glandulifera]|uniref:putative pectinesterase 52 n=1 Tax=Impatiens glandulifera TaxID=253017 RepID=UPI001FB12CCF|nr:putative pectinesterase 52 [Impatiens glandulifera]
MAVAIYGDKSAFYNCGFIGIQDTLFDGPGRHYYKSCYIEGAEDFIWGYGQSVFESCTINVTSVELIGGIGYITAQGRQSEQDPGGFVFTNGNVVGNGKTFLGRAYSPFSRVIFSQMTLSSIVDPLGWSAWNFGEDLSRMWRLVAEDQGPTLHDGHLGQR